MKNKKLWLHGLLILILMLSIMFGLNLKRDNLEEKILTEKEAATMAFYTQINEFISLIEEQAKVDQEMITELNNGNYTFEDPLIIIDPYELSPLTAIVMFKSSQQTSISIHVEGKSTQADLDYSIDRFTTTHIIPVYGLLSGIENNVILTSKNLDGLIVSHTISISTESIIPDLDTNRFLIFSSGRDISPGFTFSYQNGFNHGYKNAIDVNGDYRWYLSHEFNKVSNYNQGKSVFLTVGDENAEIIIVEMNYLGRILNLYYSPFGAHHDLFVSDRRFLITGSSNTPSTIEDFVYTINRKTGEIENTLSFLDVLVRTRVHGVFYTNKDWLHMNSIVEEGSNIIVSNRHQSNVVETDWEGNIQWILGDPTEYTTAFLEYLLKPIGKDFQFPYNQHAVEVLPDLDHNPDTIDILLFDNGNSRFAVNKELQLQIKSNTITAPDLYSRMVQYRIDEKKMTVQQIWQYGSNRPEIYSSSMGDANLLENGNFLGMFFVDNNVDQIHPQSSVYVEIDSNQNVVWECVATSTNPQNSYIEYRAERFEIYNKSSENLEIGNPVQILIPNDILLKAANYRKNLNQ